MGCRQGGYKPFTRRAPHQEEEEEKEEDFSRLSISRCYRRKRRRRRRRKMVSTDFAEESSTPTKRNTGQRNLVCIHNTRNLKYIFPLSLSSFPSLFHPSAPPVAPPVAPHYFFLTLPPSSDILQITVSPKNIKMYNNNLLISMLCSMLVDSYSLFLRATLPTTSTSIAGFTFSATTV